MIATASTLKKSCMVAAVKASLNSSDLLAWPERNERVGDGGADVGTHDHRHGGLHREAARGDERHDGRRGDRRRLNEDGGKDADGQRGDRIRDAFEEALVGPTADALDAAFEKTNADQEEVEQEDDEERSCPSRQSAAR